jgi:transketolase
VDGTSIEALLAAFRAAPFSTGKPSLVLARTVKGRGVSFIENNAAWHHSVPSEAQYKQAMAELSEQLSKCRE